MSLGSLSLRMYSYSHPASTSLFTQSLTIAGPTEHRKRDPLLHWGRVYLFRHLYAHAISQPSCKSATFPDHRSQVGDQGTTCWFGVA